MMQSQTQNEVSHHSIKLRNLCYDEKDEGQL